MSSCYLLVVARSSSTGTLAPADAEAATPRHLSAVILLAEVRGREGRSQVGFEHLALLCKATAAKTCWLVARCHSTLARVCATWCHTRALARTHISAAGGYMRPRSGLSSYHTCSPYSDVHNLRGWCSACTSSAPEVQETYQALAVVTSQPPVD